MAWSTAQVARMSRVTSRTLRHYDEIGLLRPAKVGGNGYRYYEREQLLRLQQIMVLRDLGLGLDAIARVVNDGASVAEQLRRHHRWLAAERDRYDRLASTVARTIEELEGGETVSMEKLFEGFDAQRQAGYEAELVERYGDGMATHLEESKRRVAGLSSADAERVQAQWADFAPRLVALIEAGAKVDDARVQAVIADHYRWVTNFWTPDRDSYPGLGDLYADAPDFRRQFDAAHPRLAEFLRDAMATYAAANL
ncbi:MAG TPA: MerR family transcriptional regulator [Pilimelia sp.]|nr:MerR family transcriptional regulator [Pilimelia sp.]